MALEGDNEDDPRHLLYVPTGPNDPNVIYDPAFDQQAFFNFVAAEGLSPGFQARNDFHSKWSTRFDFAIRQEVRFTDELSGRVYMKIYNVGNLLKQRLGQAVRRTIRQPGCRRCVG